MRMGDANGPQQASLAEAFGTLVELQQEGLTRYLGVSNVTAEQMAEAQSIAPIVSVQNMYNLAHRDDDALIDRLAGEGVAFTPFFPLGGFSPLQSEALSSVARRLETTPMAVALAWLLQRSPNILPAHPGHLEDRPPARERHGRRNLAVRGGHRRIGRDRRLIPGPSRDARGKAHRLGDGVPLSRAHPAHSRHELIAEVLPLPLREQRPVEIREQRVRHGERAHARGGELDSSGAILIWSVIPVQKEMLAHPPTDRCLRSKAMMSAGIMNMIWMAVVVLMVTQPNW